MMRKLLERPIGTACASSLLLHGALFLLFVAWMAWPHGAASSVTSVPPDEAAVVDPGMFQIETVPEAPLVPEPPLPVPDPAQATKPPLLLPPAEAVAAPRKTFVMAEQPPEETAPAPPAAPALQPVTLEESRVVISDRNRTIGSKPAVEIPGPREVALPDTPEELPSTHTPLPINTHALVRDEMDTPSMREPQPVPAPVPPRTTKRPAQDYITPYSVPGDGADAVASPLYAYHQQVRRAIFVSWLNKSAGVRPGAGTLKVIFFLTREGAPEDIQVVKDDAGPVSRRLLLQSILSAAIPAIPQVVLTTHADGMDRGRLPYTFDIQIRPSQQE